jgi:hypothetical protein
MKHLFMLLVLANSCIAAASTPRQPLQSGTYTFQHKFAEHPDMPSISLTAKISRGRIKLINNSQSAVFPKGVIASGKLMWHASSSEWIIGHNKSDQFAKEAGGCSDGPEVVDLELKIYWTC